MDELPGIGVLQARVLVLEQELQRLMDDRACSRCRTTKTEKVVPIDCLRPSQAIVTCLREFDRPVGVGRVRQRLESSGYPMKKFGQNMNYFYTLICRLADSGKIERGDGDEIMLTG